MVNSNVVRSGDRPVLPEPVPGPEQGHPAPSFSRAPPAARPRGLQGPGEARRLEHVPPRGRPPCRRHIR